MAMVTHQDPIAATAQTPDTTFWLRGRRHPWRWIVAAIAAYLLAGVVASLAVNPAMDWSTVGEYLFNQQILDGLVVTLWLTLVVSVLGNVLGAVVAACWLSQNPVLRIFAWGYVWIFRSIPMLVQLLFWFNIGYLYPVIFFGLPFLPPVGSIPTNQLVTATVAAIVGLTLHETAFASEIIRGGILSVDLGQKEAATALGISRRRALVRIVLPQAMRAIIPSLGNLLILTLKGTAIVSIIAVSDLLYSAQYIYNQNFKVIPLLVVASLWYLVITSVLSILQHYLEEYFSRGAVRTAPKRSWKSRLRSVATGTEEGAR